MVSVIIDSEDMVLFFGSTGSLLLAYRLSLVVASMGYSFVAERRCLGFSSCGT